MDTIFEGRDTKRRRVVVTREPSGDPTHPGRYRLVHDGREVDVADAEFMGRAFDVTGFITRAGIRLPKATEPVEHLGKD